MDTKELNLAKFQNLFLMANADGLLEEKEKDKLSDYIKLLGLDPNQCHEIIKNRENLNFVVPDDKEAAYNDLKELVAMMLSDGHIANDEYKRCMQYALSAGISRLELDNLIKSYIDQDSKDKEYIYENTLIYQKIFNKLKATKLSDGVIAGKIKLAVENKEFSQTFPDAETELIFCQLLWLMYVRGSSINHKLLASNDIICGLIIDGKDSLAVLLDTLQMNEEAYGTSKISISNDIKEIKGDLEDFFEK